MHHSGVLTTAWSLLGLATLNQICAQSHCCPVYLQEGVMIKEAALH